MIWAFWSVLIAAASYGVLSTGVALCYAHGAGLGDVVAAQVWVGFGVLLIWAGPSLIRSMRDGLWSPKDLIYGLGLGAATTLIGFFYYRAVGILGVSWSVLLLFQYPWLSMALDWLRHRRLPLASELLILGFLALGTLAASGARWDHLQWSGVLWGLLAAACYGAFLFGNTRIKSQAPALAKALWIQTGGLLCLLLIWILNFWAQRPSLWIHWEFWHSASLPVLGLALGLGIFGCVLPPWLMAVGMPRVGVFWGSVISAVELPLAMALGALVLGETLSTAMIAGGLCVALAPALPWLLIPRKST